MKIVDVSEFYAEQGGGVRTYTNQKLEAGAKAGIEVVVVAPGPEDREEQRLGGRIRWVKGPPMPLDPRYYVLHRERAVHQILDEERPDIVEGSSTWTAGWFAARWQAPANWQGAKALIFHQDPVAVYPHTFLDRWVPRDRIDAWCSPYWNYLGRLSEHYDHTVVAGQWLADRLAGRGVKSPKAVAFGVRKDELDPRFRSEEVRRRWLREAGAPEDGILFVGISRHHPEKRLGTLLKGFEEANKKLGGRAAFVLFGDGPLRSWVQRLGAQTPGVLVAGFTKNRQELADALASADAFLHGSAAETFGIVLAEALCSGLPLVVPEVGGAEDLAYPSWSETYEPGDIAGCGEAIVRLSRRDPSSLREAVLGARENRVRSIEEHFEALFELYAGMLP